MQHPFRLSNDNALIPVRAFLLVIPTKSHSKTLRANDCSAVLQNSTFRRLAMNFEAYLWVCIYEIFYVKQS